MKNTHLTRFSLFFPEKRLFFQERSGIFDFTVGSRNNLFYSRRIGIDSDGNSIPILGGARVTGRTGNWDIGLISMQTKSTDAFASNNYSVSSVRVFIDDSSFDSENSIIITSKCICTFVLIRIKTKATINIKQAHCPAPSSPQLFVIREKLSLLFALVYVICDI